MARKKFAKLITDDEEDFIEEPHFDRQDMTASEAILNFGLIFFAAGAITTVLAYFFGDKMIFYDIANISYINPMFVFTVIYIILKVMISNLFAIMLTTPYIFKGKTLYEGDEEIFYNYLIILFIIYALLMGLFDYLIYHSILHAIIYTGSNLSTMYIILPSLTKDIKRLYIY